MVIDKNIYNNATEICKLALIEDCAKNDLSGLIAFNNNEHCKVNVVARENIVIAGLPIISIVYNLLDKNIKVELKTQDAQKVNAGELLAVVSGKALNVLAGERTALNFIQRLSGIATLTAKYVDKVKNTKAKIVDTRKTTPGWRALEKYAVKCGGGLNHRFNLADMIMFKDNHIALSGKSISQLIKSAKKNYPNVTIACEADTIEQVKCLVKTDVDIIMLDNMTIDMMKKAVKIANGNFLLEATGGISLNNVKNIAEIGVDRISIGAITHSVKSVDIGMDVEINE